MYAVKVLPRRGGPVGWLADAQGDVVTFETIEAALGAAPEAVFPTRFALRVGAKPTEVGGCVVAESDFFIGGFEDFVAAREQVLRGKLASLVPVPDFPDDEGIPWEG